MYIHNATFMILHQRETEFLSWLRQRIPEISGKIRYMESPRLSSLVEAGGVSRDMSDALSIAFQVGFESEEEARSYGDNILAELIVNFERIFGPEAVVFTSIFCTLPLK